MTNPALTILKQRADEVQEELLRQRDRRKVAMVEVDSARDIVRRHDERVGALVDELRSIREAMNTLSDPLSPPPGA